MYPPAPSESSHEKPPVSDRKIQANHRNARRSTGPKNTSATRFNAAKHGLLAAGVTELDDAEGYRAMLRDLTQEKNPVGVIEVFFVESATLEMIRLRRARRLEAEFITAVMNPPIHGTLLPDYGELDKASILDPGLPALMPCENIQPLVSLYQRYESTFALRLIRTLHELERLQRMRQGERLPAPASIDVNVHADAQGLDAFAESSNRNALEGLESKPDDKEKGEIDESLRNG